MTNEQTEFVPDVPLSAEEERAQQNGTPSTERPKPRVFDCSTCGDTGKVRILFSSPTGLMPGKAEMGCPDCGKGKVEIEGSDGRKIESLENAIKVIKIAALIALAVALGIIVITNRPEGPWTKAAKEAVKE